MRISKCKARIIAQSSWFQHVNRRLDRKIEGDRELLSWSVKQKILNPSRPPFCHVLSINPVWDLDPHHGRTRVCRCLCAVQACVCLAAAQKKPVDDIHRIKGPIPVDTLGWMQLKCLSGIWYQQPLDKLLQQPRGAASFCKWMMAELAGLSSFSKFLWPVNSLFLSHSSFFPFHHCGDFFLFAVFLFLTYTW